MIIRSIETKLLPKSNRRAQKYDKFKSRLSSFCENAVKKNNIYAVMVFEIAFRALLA